MKLIYSLCVLLCMQTGLMASNQALQIVFGIYPATCGNSTGSINPNVSGGVTPYTYLWSNSATTLKLSAVPAGSYTLVVTDALGATVSATAVVANSSVLSINASPYPSIGPGNEGHLEVEIPNGVAPYSLSRCFGWTGTSATDTFTFSGLSGYNPPGPSSPPDCMPSNMNDGYVYTFSVTDATGCNVTFQGVVNAAGFDQPTPTVFPSCGGQANGIIADTIYFAGSQFIWSPISILAVITELPSNTIVDSIELALSGPDAVPGGIKYISNGLPAGDYMIQYHPMNIYAPVVPTWMPNVFYNDFVTITDMGNACGTISGKAYIDVNNDCAYNTGEPVEANAVVAIQPGNIYRMTDAQGNYTAALALGNYIATHSFSMNAPISSSCSSASIPVALNTIGQNFIADFADTSSGSNLTVNIWSGFMRPGIPTNFTVSVTNNSLTPSVADTLELTFDPIFGVNQLIPSTTDSGPGYIRWVVAPVAPFTTAHFYASVQLPADPLLIGNMYTAVAQLLHTADYNLNDNIDSTSRFVTGSYDPNTLSASPEGFSANHYLPLNYPRLNYFIEFQNTGNDTAITVMITDTLDQSLDPASVVAAAGSHPFTMNIEDGGVVKFTFDNIMLADSNTNEAASHGYIGFSVALKPGLAAGTFIENTAHIFFDANPAVSTNSFSHLLYDCDQITATLPFTADACAEESVQMSLQTFLPSELNWYLDSVYVGTGSSVIFPDVVAGIHTITTEAITPYCSQVQSTMFVVNPLPVVNVWLDGDTLHCTISAGLIQWYFDGIAIPNATDSLLLIGNPGQYTVVGTDFNGCSSTSTSVNVGLMSVPAVQQLHISPNPGTDHVNVTVPWSYKGPVTLYVFDVTGRLVINESIEQHDVYSLNTSALEKGVYQVELSNNGSRAVSRWVKQ